MIVLTSVDRRTKLGALVLDVLLTEEVDFESQVTLYPIETGALITDHVTRGAEKIRLSGMMSTADVTGGQGTAAAFGFGVDNSTKLVDVIEMLRGMHAARALVEVSTGQMVYKDFAFTTLNAQRSAGGDGGNWLSIKAELTKVNKVTLKKADVPPPETAQEPADGRAGQTNKPAGKTTPSTTNNGARNGVADSYLYQGRQAITNPAPGGFIDNFQRGGARLLGIGR